jgi:hypothetical protein
MQEKLVCILRNPFVDEVTGAYTDPSDDPPSQVTTRDRLSLGVPYRREAVNIGQRLGQCSITWDGRRASRYLQGLGSKRYFVIRIVRSSNSRSLENLGLPFVDTHPPLRHISHLDNLNVLDDKSERNVLKAAEAGRWGPLSSCNLDVHGQL